jgi:signal peptidase I
LILTVLTFVTGVIVAINRFVWRYGIDAPPPGDPQAGDVNAAGSTEKASERQHPSGFMMTLVDYSRSFFPVLLFVLVIRSFVFEPFRIPSGSMMPTLLQGDFIFVKKYAYGLRLPVIETKVFETGAPERGDVVVFRLPEQPSVNYIKRVVGLPGDQVVYRRHRLVINGEAVELDKADDATLSNPKFVEELGQRQHDILIEDRSYTSGDGTFVVPEGHYFVMGDNRDNSRDSRFIGGIPETHLVGEAVRIWMHMDGLSWPRWDRIGEKIQ